MDGSVKSSYVNVLWDQFHASWHLLMHPMTMRFHRNINIPFLLPLAKFGNSFFKAFNSLNTTDEWKLIQMFDLLSVCYLMQYCSAWA